MSLKFRNKLILFLFVAIFIGIALTLKPQSLNEYASQIIKKCATESYRKGCYDEMLPNLVDKISLDDSLKIVALVQKKDNSFLWCHVTAHRLGSKAVRNNPNNWNDVLSSCLTDQCNNGCLHGALQEHFKSDYLSKNDINNIKPIFRTLCESRQNWNPTQIEKTQCYHALGHISLYMNSGEINKALEFCNQIITKNTYPELKFCFDGLFMQMFQPFEPDDFALIKGKEIKKDELIRYCTGLPEIEQNSCLISGWVLYRNEIKNPSFLDKYCKNLKDSENQKRCMAGVENSIVNELNGNVKKLVSYCNGLSQENINVCFGNIALSLVTTFNYGKDLNEIKKAIEMCYSAGSIASSKNCFERLADLAKNIYHKDSQEYTSFCKQLPEDWKNKCLKN